MSLCGGISGLKSRNKYNVKKLKKRKKKIFKIKNKTKNRNNVMKIKKNSRKSDMRNTVCFMMIDKKSELIAWAITSL